MTLAALWDIPGADIQTAFLSSFRSAGLTPIERGCIVSLIKYAAEQSKLVPPDLGTTDMPQPEAARAGTKRKFIMTIDPTSDQEMIAPSLEEAQGYLSSYDSINGGLPLVSEEPTGEQFKGVKLQLDAGNPPYTGFSIFGPDGRGSKHVSNSTHSYA